MSKNYLLIYSEQLATEIELLCQNIKASSNTLFQIRKSSSSIYANIRERNIVYSSGARMNKIFAFSKEHIHFCVNHTTFWLFYPISAPFR